MNTSAVFSVSHLHHYSLELVYYFPSRFHRFRPDVDLLRFQIVPKCIHVKGEDILRLCIVNRWFAKLLKGGFDMLDK
ncbi:hypothetical protein M514_22259 [Trichuris suis]|uniref:Uncharacterized protein n=1 Tax=Trichuris suis TaxID=68888 RepID=A0A085N7V4_9BILA|nr:hypothetical protein M514_22259 [Trichuris suis]